MNIRSAELRDINRIVEIHCSAFDGFFLTSLGSDFLRLYYRSYLNFSQALLLCAEDNDEVVGFSATAKLVNGFNTQLIKRNLCGFLWMGVKLLFTNPMSLIRLYKNMTKGGESTDSGGYAELYSIGVHETAQRKGIGAMLLSETEKRLAEEHIQRVSLTTDARENEATQAFYRTMGYELLYEFKTYPQRQMLRLMKKL